MGDWSGAVEGADNSRSPGSRRRPLRPPPGSPPAPRPSATHTGAIWCGCAPVQRPRSRFAAQGSAVGVAPGQAYEMSLIRVMRDIESGSGAFLVLEASDPRVVGAVAFRRIDIFCEQHVAEFGFCIGPARFDRVADLDAAVAVGIGKWRLRSPPRTTISAPWRNRPGHRGRTVAKEVALRWWTDRPADHAARRGTGSSTRQIAGGVLR